MCSDLRYLNCLSHFALSSLMYHFPAYVHTYKHTNNIGAECGEAESFNAFASSQIFSKMRRRKHDLNEKDSKRAAEEESSELQDTRKAAECVSSSPQDSQFEHVLRMILIVTRIAGCFLFAYGWHLGQKQLCTHEECSMTYSMREYIQIGVPELSAHRLYKFTDKRDPRHSPFHRQAQPLRGNAWCLDSESTKIVLYVPGHGKFSQSFMIYESTALAIRLTSCSV